VRERPRPFLPSTGRRVASSVRMTSRRTVEETFLLCEHPIFRVLRTLFFISPPPFYMEDTSTTPDNTSYVLALDADAGGTHVFSEIWISPAAVIHCFGQGSNGDEYKVSRQWTFRKGELIFTLYDWKSTDLYDSEMWSPEQLWASKEPFPLHIGSKEPATHDDAEEFARFVRDITNLAG